MVYSGWICKNNEKKAVGKFLNLTYTSNNEINTSYRGPADLAKMKEQ